MKTICSPEVFQGYDANDDFCRTHNMKMAKTESPEAQSALIAFTNKQYGWAVPGGVWIDGVKGGGYCKCLTNYYTWQADYKVAEWTCATQRYGYCEFKQPRGEDKNDCDQLLTGINNYCF